MSAKTLGDEIREENAQAAYKREMERHKQATMTELEKLIEWASDEVSEGDDWIAASRAELAQLHQRIENQARQLEDVFYICLNARELLESVYGKNANQSKTVLSLRNWLAANQPEAEPQP